MLLQNKTAIVYGGAGAVGAAIARAFAAAGARVYLAGRTLSTLRTVADEIIAAGGAAEPAVVDALDRASIETQADQVMRAAGAIDISFNAIDSRSVQGKPMVDMTAGDFNQPIATYVTSNFLTGTAAARRMAAKGSGVIMTLTARPDLTKVQNSGGFGVACAAVEAFCRHLAAEVGPQGIRVVCLRSAGSPDAAGVREAFTIHARNAGMTFEELVTKAGSGALLRHLPLLAEVADMAVLMASDRARAVTAAIANVTCGDLVD